MIAPDGIKVLEVRVRNFRCLKSVDVSIDNDITVLIGENNAGKTSFIEAFNLAVGAGKRSFSVSDIYVDASELQVPRERSVIIDVLIRPVDNEGEIAQTFEGGSFWLALWGVGIGQDDSDNDFAGIRTEIKWDVTRSEYTIERKFLAEWVDDSSKIEQAKVNESAGVVTSRQIEPFVLYVLDAQRDIQEELQNRNSFWGKLVADPGLSDEKVKHLEEILTGVNNEIVSTSKVLTHVETHLQGLQSTTVAVDGKVTVSSIPRRLRDFKKGMDVHFAIKGAQSFPVETYGMGTRSLAAILVFRAYTTWRQQLSKSDALHPMLAIEEPESHLHPDAQRALFTLISQIPGQRILSTHSPYVAAQTQLNKFRFFQRVGSETVVRQIDTFSLGNEAVTTIERVILMTRGDLLFSRAIVVFEGQTEELAFPEFAEHYWGRHAHSLGVSFVRADGKRYRPFVNLAQSAGIPWYIFSDGEADTEISVRNAVTEAGEAYPSSKVFTIPDGQNFESFLCQAKYKDALIDGIIEYDAQNEAHKAGLTKQWGQESNPMTKIEERLKALKPHYGKCIARAFIRMPHKELRIPSLIRSLFEKISSDLAIPVPEASE